MTRVTIPEISDYESEQDLLDNTVELGKEAEKFIQSKIGKYLIDKSNEEVEAALEGLIYVDSEDPKAIRVLQNQISIAKAIQQWLVQAVDEGIQAESEQSSLQ